MTTAKKTVAVGLSGGVDSAMTAYLLQQLGYNVVGLTMQIWDGTYALEDEHRSGCFGPGEDRDIASAASTAEKLGIPHHIVPLAEEYKSEVIGYFRTEYLQGRTPNPCLHCNKRMKFELLLERARSSGLAFDLFATGHYARVFFDPARRRYCLGRAKDAAKDQTYFLSRLTQQQLAAIVLPMGEMIKGQVKQLARELGWVELAERDESQDFIESKDYSALFTDDERCCGSIVDRDGRELGRHAGIINFTIGQRRGLRLGGSPEPLYVVNLDPGENRVIVGPREALQASGLRADQLNWISFDAPPAEALRVKAKIRQQHKPADATLQPGGRPGEIEVHFVEPQSAVAPGQGVAFYDGDIVVGSGIIAERL